MADPARRLALALVVAVTTATPAYAHKLKVFATAGGATIDGRVYFVGGAPAPGAEVTVEAPPGTPVATMATDGDGRFRLEASSRTDHLIVAAIRDGHVARFTVTARDLPAALLAAAAKAPSSSAVASSAVASSAVASSAGEGDGGGAEPSGPAALPSLQDIVAEAVASQIRPLREQLNDFEDQVRFRDIVGGIGYIFGLAGTVLWLKAARPPRARR